MNFPQLTRSGNLPGVTSYPRIHVDFGGWGQSEENRTACSLLLEAVQLRAKYLSALEKPLPPAIVLTAGSHKSSPPPPVAASATAAAPPATVFLAPPTSALRPQSTPLRSPVVSPTPSPPTVTSEIPSGTEFVRDYDRILEICATGPVVSYSLKRLKVLEYAFNFHKLLNSRREGNATKYTPVDSSTITRVDTRSSPTFSLFKNKTNGRFIRTDVHLAAAMSEKHLLEFIKKKLATFPNEVVMIKDGKELTLKQVFESLGLDESRLSVSSLDVHAGSKTFHRFDQFNALYNPFGLTDLRTIFLKTGNLLKGRYLAELTKELFDRVESSSKKSEYRISIYGKSRREWSELAGWIKRFNVRSPSNRWLIQVPRIYSQLRQQNAVSDFQALLDNIFEPLFTVTENPKSDPELAEFLDDVSGFDSVDDESRIDLRLEKQLPDPATWTQEANPPYMYYMYFMFRNIALLNQARRARNMSTFDFRPHAGESGSERHLAATFLTATGINHGINLEKIPALQYLYYLSNIGICASPLSNNSLFLSYSQNPFPLFFRRGLNVSLSTDDPLQFHYTQSPLLEEYAIASRFWKLTEVDLAEIARNSVTHSGYPDEMKAKWLGPQWKLPGTMGNDPFRTNVPMIRAHFRNASFEAEAKLMHAMIGGKLALNTSPPPGIPIGYASITISGAILLQTDEANEETLKVLPILLEALDMRDKYWVKAFDRMIGEKLADKPPKSEHVFTMRDGVMMLYTSPLVLCHNDETEPATVRCETCDTECCSECDAALHKAPSKRGHVRTSHTPTQAMYEPISFEQFVRDYARLCEICSFGPCRTLCWQRNHLLQERFHFHLLINDGLEDEAVKTSGTDFYRVNKVDTHVHANRSMNSTQLLCFIKSKLFSERDTVVWKKFHGRENVTLGETFEILGLKERNLNLDALNVRADEDTYMRFDTWIAKYEPFGKSELRDLFLKTTNDINGRYLAELLGDTIFPQLRANPALKYELRLSVCGNRRSEWDELAHWALSHRLRIENNRWLVQIPRVYHLIFADGLVTNFDQILENIFMPLFEVTRDPNSHPELHEFLKDVSGFDTVGDETAMERSMDVSMPRPAQWNTKEQPPYAYWLYFLNANIQSLNSFRRMRSLNIFDFRPHCGESGDPFHLAAGFLTAKHINHGTQLANHPVLQYLYYITQIGIAAAPLSESTVHLHYENDPFPLFVKRGLNMSLSTDNPLQLHVTTEPLIEEYATAAQMWKLSQADLCEIARNSIIQCGFTFEEKESWIGPKFWRQEVQFNDVAKTNVPNVRLRFRRETYLDEVAFLRQMQRSQASEMSSLLCLV